MTAFVTRTIRQAAFVLAFAASVSALSSTSSFGFRAVVDLELCLHG